MDDASTQSLAVLTAITCKAENIARRNRRARQRVSEATEKVVAEREATEMVGEDMDLGASGLATASDPSAVAAGRKKPSAKPKFVPAKWPGILDD